MNVTKTVDEVRRYIAGVLEGAGASPEAADTVASALVYADARGTSSHGINMLEAYLERIEKGGIDPSAMPEVVREDAVTVVLDACDGFGQVGAQGLTDRLLRKMEDVSVACGSVRRLNHCGALAYYTEQAAREGYVAFLFVNANPTVAPFGGMEAVLGTNPMSVAVPHGESPIVLDMASSAVAKGKIYHAAKVGERIDPTWALDAEGNPTDDPGKAINGVLNAMAGPKGYGIALVVEALAGVMSGSGFLGEVSSLHKDPSAGMNAGAFMVLVDPRAFLDEGEYEERMDRLVDTVKGSKARPGCSIFMPGEIEQGKLSKAKSDGIVYDAVFFER